MGDFDMCFPCCIILCGCESYTQRVASPSPEMVRTIEQTTVFHCLHCMNMRQPAVLRHVDWFSLFCVPLFPYRYGDPYIGCPICRQPMRAGSAANQCSGCHHWVEDNQSFCPHCGKHGASVPVIFNLTHFKPGEVVIPTEEKEET